MHTLYASWIYKNAHCSVRVVVSCSFFLSLIITIFYGRFFPYIERRKGLLLSDFSATNQILTITEKNVKVVRQFVCADFVVVVVVVLSLSFLRSLSLNSFIHFLLIVCSSFQLRLFTHRKKSGRKSESVESKYAEIPIKANTLWLIVFAFCLTAPAMYTPSHHSHSLGGQSLYLHCLGWLTVISATWFFLLSNHCVIRRDSISRSLFLLFALSSFSTFVIWFSRSVCLSDFTAMKPNVGCQRKQHTVNYVNELQTHIVCTNSTKIVSAWATNDGNVAYHDKEIIYISFKMSCVVISPF